jgi:hypothetical protein
VHLFLANFAKKKFELDENRECTFLKPSQVSSRVARWFIFGTTAIRRTPVCRTPVRQILKNSSSSNSSSSNGAIRRMGQFVEWGNSSNGAIRRMGQFVELLQHQTHPDLGP